jgi:hypothetical protein
VVNKSGIRANEEKKKMKRKIGKLSQAEQEKHELEYHRMKSEEFDPLMTGAKHYIPRVLLKEQTGSKKLPY